MCYIKFLYVMTGSRSRCGMYLGVFSYTSHLCFINATVLLFMAVILLCFYTCTNHFKHQIVLCKTSPAISVVFSRWLLILPQLENSFWPFLKNGDFWVRRFWSKGSIREEKCLRWVQKFWEQEFFMALCDSS